MWNFLFIALNLLVCVLNANASLYVTDIQMNKMIELSIRKPHCRIHTDRGSIQHVVLSTDPLKIRQVPAETVITLEKVCVEGNQLSSEIQGELLNKKKIVLIYSSRIMFFAVSTLED